MYRSIVIDFLWFSKLVFFCIISSWNKFSDSVQNELVWVTLSQFGFSFPLRHPVRSTLFGLPFARVRLLIVWVTLRKVYLVDWGK